ncbi:MAG: hypothetical protein R3C97_00960 [Geminicoccaceae bacterium]
MKSAPRLLVATMLLAPGISGAEAGIDRIPASSTLRPIASDQPLRLQCWQQGKLLFEKSGLTGLNLGPLLEKNTIQLRRQNRQDTSVFVTELGESLCLVTGGGS